MKGVAKWEINLFFVRTYYLKRNIKDTVFMFARFIRANNINGI